MRVFGIFTGILVAAVVGLLLGNIGIVVPLLLCAVLRSLSRISVFPALLLAAVAGMLPDLLRLHEFPFDSIIYAAALGACRLLPLSSEERDTTPGEMLSGLTAGTVFAVGGALEAFTVGGGVPGGVEIFLFAAVSGIFLYPFCSWCADLFALLSGVEEPEPEAAPERKPRFRKRVSARELFRRGRS